MDVSTWIGGSAGLGGLVVSVYGMTRSRKTEKDNVALRQIEIALDSQQEQIDRQNTRMIQQDTKIAEQSIKIDQQTTKIRELSEQVLKCHQEKQMVIMELELLKRIL